MLEANNKAAFLDTMFKSHIVTAGNGTSQIAPCVLSITW